MVALEEVEKWWSRYIGSRFLDWREELIVLNRLRKQKDVNFKRLAAMYLTTKYWQYVRRIVLKRDGYTCVECGSKRDVHVDHIRYTKGVFGKEKLENLQTLCVVCHVKKTKKFDMRSSAKMSGMRVDIDRELYEMVRG